MIHTSQVANCWHALRSDYDAGKIDVEECHLGQAALYRLVKDTQGEAFANLWVGEQWRKLAEQL